MIRALLFALLLCITTVAHAQSSHDIVVYGATPGGIAAAVQAARMGRSVVLIAPHQYIGGMMYGGLGHSDKGMAETVGGISREVFERIGKHYDKKIAWDFEPHVAETTFKAMIADAHPGKIDLVLGERLDRAHHGVAMKDHRITSITCVSGKRYDGRVFIDATYEGDLLAEAGVTYRVGREPRDMYHESLAGVLDPGKGPIRQPKVFFGKSVDPYVTPGDPSSGLLPGIQDVPLGKIGSGDHKIQAYNFRVCLTSDPTNRIPLDKPANYDPKRYELLARYIAAHPDIQLVWHGHGAGLLMISHLPNQKTDINDGGPFSTDYIGANWAYPEADDATRRRIIQDHVDFTKGLLWFIASDPRVPEAIRKQFSKYGYPKDEYTDNDHFSPQVYVREARRMVGPYVMIQQDCDGSRTHRTKPDTIGLGSYGVDSHHVQRVVHEGQVVNEGNFLAGHMPYEMPYRILTPKADECTNLLVPVCVSASHIAFGSIRMEPVWMILGQSAGAAAAIAAEDNDTVQNVPYDKLRKQLESDGQLLTLP